MAGLPLRLWRLLGPRPGGGEDPPAGPEGALPALQRGRPRLPPEDSGGPEGFADLLRTLRHKKGWKYRQARDVLGTSRWDGAAWDRQEVNDQLGTDGPWR
nr:MULTISPECIES: plasmid pRiA4b ORF-3 family protein [unclassified Nonomuraea]